MNQDVKLVVNRYGHEGHEFEVYLNILSRNLLAKSTENNGNVLAFDVLTAVVIKSTVS
jgi:hypothetical protein